MAMQEYLVDLSQSFKNQAQSRPRSAVRSRPGSAVSKPRRPNSANPNSARGLLQIPAHVVLPPQQAPEQDPNTAVHSIAQYYAEKEIMSGKEREEKRVSQQGEKRPCWPSPAKRRDKKSEDWIDRWNVVGSKDNKQQPKFRRNYFDQLPWAQVMDGQYVEHSDRHGAVNFDVFCACSQKERDTELRKRFEDHQFRSWPSNVKSAICDATSKVEQVKIPKPGPHAVPMDVLAAALAPPAPAEPQEIQKPAQEIQKPAQSSEPFERRKAFQRRSTMNGIKYWQKIQHQLWDKTAAMHSCPDYMDFYQWSLKKFGSLCRCWKMLDVDCNMKTSRGEFLALTRKHNFKGDAKKIFQIMDVDKTEQVSFFHFDPVSAVDLAELHKWATTRWGGVQNAFKALDKDRNGQLSKKEFVTAAKSYGLPSTWVVKTLFDLLDADKNGTLSEREVYVIDRWKYPPWITADPDYELTKAFKERLLKKYDRNPIRAWRLALDKKGNMRVNWDAFEHCCRQRHGLAKEVVPGLWKSLDDNMSGTLSLREFWPEAQSLLENFVTYCRLEHGSVYQAFIKMDNNGNGRLSRSEFRIVSMCCDLTEVQSDLLFDGLDIKDDGRVEADEVSFLDKWAMERDIEEEQLWNDVAKALRKIREEADDPE